MASAIAADSSSHIFVEHSTSVRRKVTVPAGNAKDPGDHEPVTSGSPQESALASPSRHMLPNLGHPCFVNIPRAGETLGNGVVVLAEDGGGARGSDMTPGNEGRGIAHGADAAEV